MENTLPDFGFNGYFENFRVENNYQLNEIGRVVAEHKERYIVKTIEGDYEAEITGNLRFSARGREDFPAVGDWVALTVYDKELAIIHKNFPRFSVIKRQSVDHQGNVQIIATNVDGAFLVQAVDRDFNINRLERYLTICNSGNVEPIIVLTKADLVDELRIQEILESIKSRLKNIPVISVSNRTQLGYDSILAFIQKGKTYCLLGSSGVGKSTLLNKLSGKELMKTGSISESTHKGKHVTSHRELIILETGGILIDNPGMRELGIADTADGLEVTFNAILQLAENCRYADCTHTTEADCAVIEAVEKGEISNASYENYLKLEREKAHYESTLFEKRKKEKQFGKIMKNYKKDVKRNNL